MDTSPNNELTQKEMPDKMTVLVTI